MVTKGPTAPFEPCPFPLGTRKAEQHHPPFSCLKIVWWVHLVRGTEQSLLASTPCTPLAESPEHLNGFRYHHPKVPFSKCLRLNFCGLILGPDLSGAKCQRCWSHCGSVGWYLLRSSPWVQSERCCLRFFTCFHRGSLMCCNSSCIP